MGANLRDMPVHPALHGLRRQHPQVDPDVPVPRRHGRLLRRRAVLGPGGVQPALDCKDLHILTPHAMRAEERRWTNCVPSYYFVP